MFKPDANGGGVSSGSKNYLSAYNNNPGNGDFENASTTGFSLGTTGALTNGLPTGSPTFGSGASGNLSLSLVSSGQLAALYSASYASSAATTVGNMLASSAFIIDIEDQAKKLSWSLSYKAQTNPGNANWSGTSSNSYAVAFWDVTNSVWLTTNGQFNLIQSAGVGLATGTMQTQSSTLQVRMVVYNANATSGAVTVYFDDFVCGPSSVSPSTSVVAASYYCSTNQAGTTSAPFNFDTKEYDTAASVTTGAAWQFLAPVTGTYQVNMVANQTGNALARSLIYKSTAGGAFAAYKYINIGNTSIGINTGSTAVQLNAGDAIQIRPDTSVSLTGGSLASVAANLSIILLQSQPGAGVGGVVAAQTQLAANQSVTSGNPIKFDTVLHDTTASYSTSTGLYTVPISGFYRVGANIRTVSGATGVNLFKNGSFFATLVDLATGSNSFGGATVLCNAGDTLSINLDTSLSIAGSTGGFTTNGYFELLQGTPAAVSSSAVVAASAHVSSGSSTTALNPINYDTIDFDTTASITTGASTWQFKAPVSGYYNAAATGFFGASVDILLYKNGTKYRFLTTTTAGSGNSGSTGVQLNAGDTIDFRPAVTVTPSVPSSATVGQANNITISLVK